MTARQVYEACLIELRKENAPNLILEDFIYFANKSISQYINKRYNIYDMNQQTTDDLRVLKATALLRPEKVNSYNDLSTVEGHMAAYYVNLPDDYLHILNCVCVYELLKTYKCYNAGDTWRAAATRLTADAYSQILDNFWLKPTYKRPYFYIHNINALDPTPNTQGGIEAEIRNKNTMDSTSSDEELEGKVDRDGNYIVQGTNNRSYIKLNDLKVSTVERGQNIRYGNASKVRMEIRYGTDDSIFLLKNVYIDYLKTPLYIRLTQEELDRTEDISLVLEFPDYVCQEIINELVHIIMENISDLRLQTHPVVSLSIANPAQALAPAAAGQSA